MKQLTEYLAIEREILEYFGFDYGAYEGSIPLDDYTNVYWTLPDGEAGSVRYCDYEKADLYDDDAIHAEIEIFLHEDLEKSVCRGAEYTMIVVSLESGPILRIFDNAKERKPEHEEKAITPEPIDPYPAHTALAALFQGEDPANDDIYTAELAVVEEFESLKAKLEAVQS